MCLVGLHYWRKNKSFMLQVGYAPVIVSIMFPFCSWGGKKSWMAQLFRNCNYQRRRGCFALCLRGNVSQRKLQSRTPRLVITRQQWNWWRTRTWWLQLKVQLLKIFKGQCRSRLIFPFCWIKPGKETRPQISSPCLWIKSTPNYNPECQMLFSFFVVICSLSHACLTTPIFFFYYFAIGAYCSSLVAS